MDEFIDHDRISMQLNSLKEAIEETERELRELGINTRYGVKEEEIESAASRLMTQEKVASKSVESQPSPSNLPQSTSEIQPQQSTVQPSTKSSLNLSLQSEQIQQTQIASKSVQLSKDIKEAPKPSQPLIKEQTAQGEEKKEEMVTKAENLIKEEQKEEKEKQVQVRPSAITEESKLKEAKEKIVENKVEEKESEKLNYQTANIAPSALGSDFKGIAIEKEEKSEIAPAGFEIPTEMRSQIHSQISVEQLSPASINELISLLYKLIQSNAEASAQIKEAITTFQEQLSEQIIKAGLNEIAKMLV
jgi:hypothetical protein